MSGPPSDLLGSLCRTYADLLTRQRIAATPLVKWTHATRRSHEFVWLGGVLDREPLFGASGDLEISPGGELFDDVHKMYSTAKLNPYEREIVYGYPVVVGRRGGRTIRGPLLTVPVEIVAAGSHLAVRLDDDVVRFNTLPFRSNDDTEARDQALARVMAATPGLPLAAPDLQRFMAVIALELPDVEVDAALDGSLGEVPAEPAGGDFLVVVDQAALLVAPKTNYFLRSDLEEIATEPSAEFGPLVPLLRGAGMDEQVDFTNDELDSAQLYFPFPSNREQRRVAMLVEDSTTQLVRVEGPPGTGKSLTIANLACHLAATGRRVLITSQKDKALEVVDAKLRELDLAEVPMTLLRHERESKRDLLNRLDRIEKRRPKDEVEAHHAQFEQRFISAAEDQVEDAHSFGASLRWEDAVERAQIEWRTAKRLRRLARARRARSTLRKANRRAPETTAELAERIRVRRGQLLNMSIQSLRIGLERGVATAKRGERQVIRALQDVLKRNQRTHRNFSLFDQLKAHSDSAAMLLKLLPVWILSPDDVARLFPCRAGLFDVVVIDEASQVDLPSILPIVYRGKTVVIFGDTRQMQSQRFAFVSRAVASEAWAKFGMDLLDPAQQLHPKQNSLLSLAAIRAQEEVLLREHYRSLPPIIEFSNHRWYDDALRIMTDPRRKAFGSPSQPIAQLHHVEDGTISNGGQENEIEARAVVALLSRMVSDPDYSGASIGVLCLFEEQVALMHELVAETIPPEEWEEHSIVVVNPDGFQGDERDVILYSLSWDDDVMPRSALGQRQRDDAHVQGMLNVAFTRARDEIHIFHSAPIDTFGMAGGRSGALRDWLEHCAAAQNQGGTRRSARHDRIDSEFEADVAMGLRSRGVTVLHQYPSCGFSIDLVCALDDRRIAVECDGELYHMDEHGNLRVEDVERQAILERAGWTVLRVPYRDWLEDREGQIERLLQALTSADDEGQSDRRTDGTSLDEPDVDRQHDGPPSNHRVTREQHALIESLRAGLRSEDDAYRDARARLGYKRLGPRIRERLQAAAIELNHLGLVVREDGEYFLTAEGRTAQLTVIRPPTKSDRQRQGAPKRAQGIRPQRRRRRRRRY